MKRSPDGREALFDSGPDQQPLAGRMRPRTIDEYIGQDHIMGRGRLLRRAIQADQISSLIFSGPPGTGKTTLARVIANSTKSDFISLNAVLAGVSELREAIDKAQTQKKLYERRTILFVDEVHRWNKSQQDALLPWVENGTIILVGATTENPFFEVNPALVSRSRVFQLKALGDDDLRAIAAQALADPLRGYGNFKVIIEADALDHLVHTASGDARSLLNALELAVETTPESWPPPIGAEIRIDLETAEESIQQKALLYDREGDYHFDSISAFIKSLRGSDPDAALYWLARMVRSGESPRFILRRMLISASEDVGLAEPQALAVVQAAAQAFDRVGMPEGQFFLAEAALFLATSPKSNSAMAYFDALASVESEKLDEVPNHLKDASRDAKGFGHGEGYQYPHAFKDHWVAQNYLPQTLQGKVFYQPGDQGYEGRIRDLIFSRREIQLAEARDPESVEQLSYSPVDRKVEYFARRTIADDWLKKLRGLVFDALGAADHSRVALVGDESMFMVPEALRRFAHGLVYALASRPSLDALAHNLAQAGLEERCELVDFGELADPAWSPPQGDVEVAIAYNLLVKGSAVKLEDSVPGQDAAFSPLAALGGVSVKSATLLCVDQKTGGLRLSELIRERHQASRDASAKSAIAVSAESPTDRAELYSRAGEGESAFYEELGAEEARRLRDLAASWELQESRDFEILQKRRLSRQALEAWFDERASYGASMSAFLGREDFLVLKLDAERLIADLELDRPRQFTLRRFRRAAANENGSSTQ